jgi:hypothetical protein
LGSFRGPFTPVTGNTLQQALRQPTSFVHPINRPFACGANAEANWWACSKCQGSFRDETNTPRTCPAGGKHSKQSGEQFTVGKEIGTSGVGGWRKCSKCNLLAKPGPCAGGNQHALDSGQYGLIGV